MRFAPAVAVFLMACPAAWPAADELRLPNIFGDFFKHDLSQADVVNCYLLQSTNEKLEAKLLRELKPGTRVVSYSFTFPNMQLLVQDRAAQIYCYQIEG